MALKGHVHGWAQALCMQVMWAMQGGPGWARPGLAHCSSYNKFGAYFWGREQWALIQNPTVPIGEQCKSVSKGVVCGPVFACAYIQLRCMFTAVRMAQRAVQVGPKGGPSRPSWPFGPSSPSRPKRPWTNITKALTEHSNLRL